MDEVSAKITKMLGPTKHPFEIAFQDIEDMHEAIPDHTGDWVFTGDFATPGGMEAVLRAFTNYYENSTERSAEDRRHVGHTCLKHSVGTHVHCNRCAYPYSVSREKNKSRLRTLE